ncbi:glycoside hydrolase family 97 catalytic domain-containing protein [Haloarcula pellucida]|uniref:glycoside hydrolase family 97 catalytic domain-containing protein n=1 Tax=Haloarcula pellucida TaxID=1427151 RepID=UPI00166D3B51|nr:glycoside hydrolase family 97 catalytic domain-containing protein [Halomicroarcula pellucida]MBX0347071.1 glycoside hydrolase family 97 catalytic domain-containing protein [Halomicroarcula pellucida]
MVSRQSQQTLNALGRREFLGGVASLLAAAAYTQDVPEDVAAQVTGGDDSDTQSVSSPDGSIGVTVDVSGGTPTYSVAFNGATYVDSSTLGFDFQNQPTFGAGSDGSTGTTITVTGSESGTETESWTPEWDQYASVSQDYNYLRLGLEETNSPGRSGNLEFRVFDDGIGFRFVFDDDFAANSGALVVSSENTQFNFAGDYTAWWIKNEFVNPRFEQEYTESKLSEIDAGTRTIRPNDNEIRTGAHTPLTIKAGENAYMSVHEANLDDYSTASIVAQSDSGGTDFTTQLAPLPDNTKASLQAPNTTPWRTIQFATSPGDLVESSLIPLLNEDRDDSALPSDGNGGVDTSWLTPKKYIGIWWTMIAGNAKWEYKTDSEISNNGNDPAAYIHGARTERMKRYMRFASQNSIDSVLAEGWNKGWDSYGSDASDTGASLEMGVADSYPDFDVSTVTNYGSSLSNPVEFTIHNETSGNIPNYETEILSDGIFSQYDDAGIHSIKNGYVSDPGLFGDNQSTPSHNQHCQLAVNHHRTVIEEAAGERQMLEIHEGIKPTGERRTYPNVAAREVVEAQEYDGFGALGSNVGREHHVTLPFTRMLAGPTSYQPGIFDITFNDSTGDQVQTTRAKQLAMYPTYNAGIQMAADRVEAYISDEFEVGEYVQAPSGTLDGMITADDWRNAFGTHYVPVDPNREASGSKVSFTVKNVPSAGTYTLHLRYASDDTENAQRVIDNGNPQFTLDVNGSTQTVSPSFTDYWDDWQIHSVDVELAQGDNTVAIVVDYDDSGDTFTGDVGGINVNTVGITAKGASAPFPATYTDLTDSQVANENVESEPDFEYIEDVPAGGWDETVVVDSSIGDYIVTARRKGEEWYVGAMTDGSGRAVEAPLDFLASKTNGWKMEMYTDAAGTDVDTNPTAIRHTESIVTTGDTVLATMGRSGGVALRLTPATSNEASTLSAYAQPTQTIDSVNFTTTQPGLGKSFIEVTASHDGNNDFVGGTPIDVQLGGETDAIENIRLAPSATTGETFTLGYNITQAGSYTVTLVDRLTGTQLAQQSITVQPGDLVAEYTDPGDDGLGAGYGFPESQKGSTFRDGAFDLEKFTIYEDESKYYFQYDVANLYDVFGGDFSPHYFVLWVRDSTRSDGSLTENGDIGLQANFASAWHYRVAVSGFASSAIDSDGNDLTTGSGTVSIDPFVNRDSNTVILPVEKAAFDDINVADMEVLPVVGSERFGGFRPVVNSVDDVGISDPIVGAKAGAADNAPRVMDVLVPPRSDETQDELLYYDDDTRATLPFTQVYRAELGTDTERIATLADDTGDPYGPATSADGANAFSYPSTDDITPEDYDMERVVVYDDGSNYRFHVHLPKLRDPFGGDYGYGLQHIQIYVRDTGAANSNTYSREGVHAGGSAENVFEEAYHRRIVAHGFASSTDVPNSTAKIPVVEDGSWNVVADADSGVSTRAVDLFSAIEITVPKSTIPSGIRGADIVPMMFSYNGFGTAGIRQVQASSGSYAFGGGSNGNHNNVIDVILPDGASQADVLDPTASDITGDDDFDGYDIPFVDGDAVANSIREAVAGADDAPVSSTHFETVRDAYESNSAVPGTGGLVPDYSDLRDIASEVADQ